MTNPYPKAQNVSLNPSGILAVPDQVNSECSHMVSLFRIREAHNSVCAALAGLDQALQMDYLR
jgi:hypothetical protein